MPEHPITRGIQEFMVNDEQHYVSYDKDPKYVLLESENVDGLEYEDYGKKSMAGWAYEYGKGRVVFTAVGTYQSCHVGSGAFRIAEESRALAAEADLTARIRRTAF